jgi:hypothetical protein
MPNYYTQRHLPNTKLDNTDLISLFFLIGLCLGIVYFYSAKSNVKTIQVIEPYYLARFEQSPEIQARFANKNYDIAISELKLESEFRNLKGKLKELNASIQKSKELLRKSQARAKLNKMLREIKTYGVESINISQMQQTVLEAGLGKVDYNLLTKAVSDYKTSVEQAKAERDRIKLERKRIKEKIAKDSKETVVFAGDIAKELAEEEIEGFIENLSIIARIGTFVVNKAQGE